jgi:hypothetical protein
LIVCLGVAVCWNGMTAPFVYDDETAVR